tara:strand:+ start:861 stop:1055 length:195 start_codon:yes stop_codon:yes gene_type:complete
MEDETMEVEQEYEAPRLVDILDSDDSSRISDAIKDVLMQKSVERVENQRQAVVSQMFDLEGNAE